MKLQSSHRLPADDREATRNRTHAAARDMPLIPGN